MSTSTASSVRCPRCSAAVRAGSDWCTLCYADLRAPAAPEPPPSPAAVVASGDEVALAAVTSSVGSRRAAPAGEPGATPVRSRGKHAKASPAETVGRSEADVLAEQLLAELAATRSGDAFGRASGLVDTTAKRAAVMIGGGIIAMSLLFVVMAVLGALL